jgi:hypothetical protein
MHELHVSAGGSPRERHPQGVEDEVGAHVRRELPADDPPAVGIDDEAEEHDALPAAQIREVRQPQRVWPGRAEVALDAIRRPMRCRVGDRGAPRLAASLCALDVV